jgi:hypothetical protein
VRGRAGGQAGMGSGQTSWSYLGGMLLFSRHVLKHTGGMRRVQGIKLMAPAAGGILRVVHAT